MMTLATILTTIVALTIIAAVVANNQIKGK